MKGLMTLSLVKRSDTDFPLMAIADVFHSLVRSGVLPIRNAQGKQIRVRNNFFNIEFDAGTAVGY